MRGAGARMMWGIPKAPLALGFAGLLPFIAGALLISIDYDLIARIEADLPFAFWSDGAHILRDYGVVILSFMSGVLWGFATKRSDWRWYAASTAPALFCFFAMGTGRHELWNLMIGFVGLLALDAVFAWKKLTPVWWMKLRVVLTLIVVACLYIGATA